MGPKLQAEDWLIFAKIKQQHLSSMVVVATRQISCAFFRIRRTGDLYSFVIVIEAR